MAMVNPGVSFSETLIDSVSIDDPVAIPLFIAYTVSAAAGVKTDVPQSVTSYAQAASLFGSSGTLAWSLRHFFENGGLSCYVLSLGEGDADTVVRLQALIAALQDAELQEVIAADHSSGLLLVPEMSELNDVEDAEGVDAPTLWYQGWQALLQLCPPGQHRFALLEMPDDSAMSATLATGSFSADLCQNAAAWWPRLQTSYQDDIGAWRLLSPLPAVAAAIQLSAAENGVWKPPANIRLAKTVRPTRNILQSQDLLNRKGIYCNLIRSFAGKGVNLWGCRTLLNDEASPWRYIQTRLLANSVQREMSQLARAYLFAPNNAQTWMKLKGQLWTWLRQQWLAGAFFGTTEEEAFTLSLGLNESMSAEDILAGKMILQIRLALLAPAEFIDISLELNMRDSSITTQDGS